VPGLGTLDLLVSTTRYLLLTTGDVVIGEDMAGLACAGVAGDITGCGESTGILLDGEDAC